MDINARMEQRRGPRRGEAAPHLTPQPKEPAFSSSVSGPLSPQKRPGGEAGAAWGQTERTVPFPGATREPTSEGPEVTTPS